ncbi:MAG TPA: histidine kinase [Solirubrobacteraceae bacterium]|nr:histidine kinase [Solirubrobacteraceae bacterium]
MSSLARPGALVSSPRKARGRRPSARSGGRYLPLLYRIAGINALLLIVAVAVTVVVLAPGRLSALARSEEAVVVLAAVAGVILTNVFLLRRVVGPVQVLTAFARQIDYSNLGQRLPGAEPTSEAGELALSFNEMLTRLEAERRESTGRVLRAQEAERLRIAQELHDQVGQELTAVLLGLSRVGARMPADMREDARSVQDAVRHSLEDVRRIAVELRPEALDDLGLASALAVLCQRFSRRLDLDVAGYVAPDLPELPAEVELVVYRVAQEALTNVARHSASSRAELALTRTGGRLLLRVRDYGLGLPADGAPGTGMRGMHERAALIGATLTIADRSGESGCEVRLEVTLGEQR